MRTLRYLTAAAAALMALMNLPIVFDDGGDDLPLPVGILVSLLGVAGIVAVVQLLRRVPWATWAVVVIGAVNVVGGVAAAVLDYNGAFIGLTVAAVGTVAGLAYARAVAGRAAVTA